ncbi:hypothetical protein AHIS1636_25240 [Arthrobacter mangrovi]|uniref:Uncharacterized protein n=1 Tax=Arthrobacter mangrovi TaxID=2966350 RepID=A0ABQ5MVS1_9MICC|nr:hypothetical protein AHIS1636_25240 [Arthrobacter mangrovi]
MLRSAVETIGSRPAGAATAAGNWAAARITTADASAVAPRTIVVRRRAERGVREERLIKVLTRAWNARAPPKEPTVTEPDRPGRAPGRWRRAGLHSQLSEDMHQLSHWQQSSHWHPK